MLSDLRRWNRRGWNENLVESVTFHFALLLSGKAWIHFLWISFLSEKKKSSFIPKFTFSVGRSKPWCLITISRHRSYARPLSKWTDCLIFKFWVLQQINPTNNMNLENITLSCHCSCRSVSVLMRMELLFRKKRCIFIAWG